MITHRVNSRVKQISVSPIQELMFRLKDRCDIVSLGWGVPSFELPAYVKEAVQKALWEDASLSQYSPLYGIPLLQDCIAARIEREEGIKVDPRREILVTVGAMEALFITLQTLLEPGDEVILPIPGFGPHAEQVRIAGGRPVYTTLLEEEGWILSIEEIETLISSRTKALILANPLNPTGSIFSQADLAAIAELACIHDFYLIIDATYHSLTYDHQMVFNPLHISELRPRLIQCYSFSKEYAMTGWRVGYLHADEHLIEEVVKIHDIAVVSASRVSQVAVLAALNGPPDYALMVKSELQRRRNVMCHRLESLKALFEYHSPTGGLYIFPRIKLFSYDAVQLSEQLLAETGVVIIPGHAFGPTCTQHVRLCFAGEVDTILEGLDRLERFAEAHGLMPRAKDHVFRK